MKIIYALLLGLLTAFSAAAQTESLDSLLRVMENLQGRAFVETALEVSDRYYQKDRHPLAADAADQAYQEALGLNNNQLAAQALHNRGRSLMRIPNARNRVYHQAYKSLEESNQLTTDPQLRLQNTELLYELAQRLNKRRDAERYQKMLLVLQGKEQIRQAEVEKEVLTEELTEMEQQQADLVEVLQRKETTLRLMSDEQIRQELLVSEQERLLDSLTFVNILDSFDLAQKELLLKQQQSDIKEKEQELELQKSQRNFVLVLAGLVLVVLAGTVHRYYAIRRHNAVLAEKNKIIENERQLNEELLLNILPQAVANELKNKGVAETQHYKQATVMFADFKGFSLISKQLSPEKLVADLDHAFKHFDDIIGRYGLEKIKTIGDAYMCAGGLPTENGTHPVNVVKAALEMQEFLEKWNASKSAGPDEPLFEARIGIHTGPLIAGVVGSKKFAYDIWGDTVNVAARMETSSEAGKVNISQATYELVKDAFDCEYRGRVPAKNVGEVQMYYVNGSRT